MKRFYTHFTQNCMLIPNLPLFPSLLQYIGRYWPWKFGQTPKNAVFWARFALHLVPAPYRHQVQVGQFYSGPVPGLWYNVYIVKCLLVPKRDRRNCCIEKSVQKVFFLNKFGTGILPYFEYAYYFYATFKLRTFVFKQKKVRKSSIFWCLVQLLFYIILSFYVNLRFFFKHLFSLILRHMIWIIKRIFIKF